MATSNSPTCGHSNSPRHDPADDGRKGCLFPGSSNRLLGQAERVRPEASAGERWSSYGPHRGRPQACPVGGWLVHRGRGLPPIRVGRFWWPPRPTGDSTMPAASPCHRRGSFSDALDQVQRRQHQHLFCFSLDAQEAVLLELAEDVGEQLLLGVVANCVRGGLGL